VTKGIRHALPDAAGGKFVTRLDSRIPPRRAWFVTPFQQARADLLGANGQAPPGSRFPTPAAPAAAQLGAAADDHRSGLADGRTLSDISTHTSWIAFNLG
jgi:hypothetical protein